MKLILSTHNLTLTKAIEDHIISRLDKLAKLNRFAVNARVTLEHDQAKAPERQFSCSIRLTLPSRPLQDPSMMRSRHRFSCLALLATSFAGLVRCLHRRLTAKGAEAQRVSPRRPVLAR